MAAEYDPGESAAASKSKKPWDDAELANLIRLRAQYPDVTWGQFEQIYYDSVTPNYRRTQDGLPCKWKSLSSKGRRQLRCPQSSSKPRWVRKPSILYNELVNAGPRHQE
jgi:hypothetical protein